MHISGEVRFLYLLRVNGDTNVLKFLQWIQGLCKDLTVGKFLYNPTFHSLLAYLESAPEKKEGPLLILESIQVTYITNKMIKVVSSPKLHSLMNQSVRGNFPLIPKGCFWWMADACPAAQTDHHSLPMLVCKTAYLAIIQHVSHSSFWLFIYLLAWKSQEANVKLRELGQETHGIILFAAICSID